MPHHALAGTGQPYLDIEKLKTGDAESFQRLYQLLYGEFVLKTFSLLHEKEETVPLINHCFIKCWLRGESLTSLNYVYAFLSTTIRNNCTAFNNNKGFRSVHYSHILETILLPSICGGLTRKELSSHISTMSPQHLKKARAAFSRFYGRRMSVTGIAREMEMQPEETANSLHTAFQVLHFILFIENI